MPVLSRGEGPEVRPLDELARQLRGRAPPLVAGILSAVVPQEGFPEFVALVQEYLPEHLGEILAGSDPARQIALFGNRFRDRYFPLAYDADWVDPEAEYIYFVRTIPIPYGGVAYDDLHNVDAWRPGYIMMGSLYLAQYDDGIALTWVEECGNWLDQETLRRIPAEGLSRQRIHQLLDDTEHEALALFVDWLSNDTGNAFLDAHPEYPFMDEWDREVVAILTQDWIQAEVVWAEMGAMAAWLEEDPGVHFNELLDFLDRRNEEFPLPRPNRPLIEVFDTPDEAERR